MRLELQCERVKSDNKGESGRQGSRTRRGEWFVKLGVKHGVEGWPASEDPCRYSSVCRGEGG